MFIYMDAPVYEEYSPVHEFFFIPYLLPGTRFCTPLKCKNEYLVLPLGDETAVQAVVGSIVSGRVRRLKKAKVSGDERPRLRAS